MYLGGQQGPGSGVPARPLLLQTTGVRPAHRLLARMSSALACVPLSTAFVPRLQDTPCPWCKLLAVSTLAMPGAVCISKASSRCADQVARHLGECICARLSHQR